MSTEFDLEKMFDEVSNLTQEETTEDGLDPRSARFVDPEVLDNPNIVPVTSVVAPRRMSFNDTKAPQSPDKPKRRFITKEIVIDKFNTKRVKLLLTPSVCDICAFDVAGKRFGGWDSAPSSEHQAILKAVEEHKRVVHPLNQNLIVDEDQVPTQWLGQAR